MFQRYGMSENLGTVAYSSDDEVFIGRDYEKSKAYSERIAGEIDEEVKALIDRAYRRCEELLTADRDTLLAVADYLETNETMDRPAFEAIMAQ